MGYIGQKISYEHFHKDLKEKLLTADASDIGFAGPRQIWDDAADIGFIMEDAKGKLWPCTLEDMDYQNEELVGWWFHLRTNHMPAKVYRILIVND